MANPLLGEVDLKTKDATYTMRLGINAIVSIEDHFDKSITEVSQLLGDGMRIGNLRTIVFYALQGHHPELAEKDAGDIITSAGFAATAAAILKAMSLAFPDAQKAGTARPPKAK